jgi:hypothetical protein
MQLRPEQVMSINDIYDLIPWSVLRKWAALVKFDEEIVNPGFPKYKNWSPKAVYADYLMDFIDEGFDYGKRSAYIKVDRLKTNDVPDQDFLEIYKLFFDVPRLEESPLDSPLRKEWDDRLESMAKYLKNKYRDEA